MECKCKTPPSHEELIKERNEKAYANIDYGDIKTSTKTTSYEDIIWDLSVKNGELKYENQMLKLQIDNIKSVLNFN